MPGAGLIPISAFSGVWLVFTVVFTTCTEVEYAAEWKHQVICATNE